MTDGQAPVDVPTTTPVPDDPPADSGPQTAADAPVVRPDTGEEVGGRKQGLTFGFPDRYQQAYKDADKAKTDKPPTARPVADALFDSGDLRPDRHPFAADEFGRCKTCGVISDGADGIHMPGLSDRFIVPPFSVLDTRQDYWQKRRRAWLSAGIRGETTSEQPYRPDGTRQPPSGAYAPAGGTYGQTDRDGYRTINMVPQTDGQPRPATDDQQSQSVQTGTSVFDPVLCEIAYRWFSCKGATVLDPFAGGVVRGLVAGALGRHYCGLELRPEQIADNEAQALEHFGPTGAWDQTNMPVWFEQDATELGSMKLGDVDLVFTCPPYADLEVYSDDPRDLSTMPYDEFAKSLARVMAQSAALLKPDRYAVWVVGEARGGWQTAEYGLVADTVKAAQAAGLALYNSAILLNAAGSAPIRAANSLRTLKLTRVHQHVLVFLKGDHKRAALACGAADGDA